MKIYCLLFCCALAFADDSQHHDENPEIESPAGHFKGSILKTYSGKDIYSFRGIRYADTPTGSNRFKNATQVRRHEGVYDATNDGPSCPQPHNGDRLISEDCLYLNVYSSALPYNSSDKSVHEVNKPVIVFLHAGAFSHHSASSKDYGPQVFLERDVVLVIPNYRLGALGFLSTGDDRAPGNAGLKDQVLALRWVQRNIRHFGGDPNQVTLMGHSAGAWSVSLHMVSPLSKGLFHRAVIMSGAATTQNHFPHDHKDLVKKQAELLDCPFDTIDNALDCLYEKSPEDFANSQSQLSHSTSYPILTFTPVIEQARSDNVHPFLTGQPEDLIREGKANFVPVYIGVNTDEFGFLVIPAEEQAQHGDNTLYNELNNKWNELAPKLFAYANNKADSSHISSELKEFYLNGEPLQAGRYHGLAKLYADALTGFQVHRFVSLLANYSPEPIYYYKYAHEGCDTFKAWSNGEHFGVVHYDEILIGFKVNGRPEHCERDLNVVGYAYRLLENFARTGNPTPNNGQKYIVKWQPFTKDHPQYLHFAIDMKLVPGYVNEERMNKWDELFPLEQH